MESIKYSKYLALDRNRVKEALVRKLEVISSGIVPKVLTATEFVGQLQHQIRFLSRLLLRWI